ncbi:MAG: polysaccharide deacetylase family protein [Oscillospiraceae bacterium]|nr:polysaccharide deacetylase family protein [Oscillospiraceae bacterium]
MRRNKQEGSMVRLPVLDGAAGKPPKKRIRVTGIIVILTVLALGGLAAGLLLHSPSKLPNPPTHPVRNSETLAGIDIASAIEWKPYRSVHYPLTKNAAVNDKVKAAVDRMTADFRAWAGGERDECYISFKASRFDEKLVSFYFMISQYHAGESNSTEKISTLTFDLENAKEYTLADLFKTRQYLQPLSQLTYASLKQLEVYQSSAVEMKLLTEGTEPDEGNYQFFALDGNELLLFFPRGKIGSAANPTDSCRIPLKELWNFLDPRFLPEDLKVPQPSAPEGTTGQARPPAGPPVTPALIPPGVTSEQKLIALTFDDGPDPSLTPGLLDFLKEEQVIVTFFVLGKRVDEYPDIVRRAAAEGHQVGSHTYHHLDLTSLSDAKRKNEIEDTASLLEHVLGYRPTTMRPPYGARNDKVRAAAGTPLILWSVDPEDWKYRNADTVYNNVLKYTADGDIILLHDIHPTSIQAAKKIIPKLKADGYTFVTVDQLLQLRGSEVAGEDYFSASR